MPQIQPEGTYPNALPLPQPETGPKAYDQLTSAELETLSEAALKRDRGADERDHGIAAPYIAEAMRARRLVTEQAALRARLSDENHRLKELAVTDELTGLYNRRGLFEQYDIARNFVRRESIERGTNIDQLCMGAVYLDLVGFKAINDTLGHDVGDDILREVAGRLQKLHKQELRTGMDIVARLGGDEFVVVSGGVPENFVHEIERRVIATFNNLYRFTATGKRLEVQPSWGSHRVAIEAPLEELLTSAETAMREHKRDYYDSRHTER